MKNNFISGILAGLGMVAVLLFSFAYAMPDAMPPINELPQLVRPPRLKESFSFAGETIPMNTDTRERMEKELLVNSYYHSSTVLAIKNAPRFFPMIEAILKEEGVPDDFKYLAVAESNLTNSSSGAGAKGIWQFMKAAAADYGLEVNTEIEERFHYEKSTRAAARFLKHLYNQTGSWVNAAAAYNMGLSNLKKAMDTQGEKSIFDLNVNDETSRYIFRIVALKEILNKPEAYGFYVEEDQQYKPFSQLKTIKITGPVESLSELAHRHGLTYRLLKYYNPWLIDSKLTVKDKTYTILVPHQ